MLPDYIDNIDSKEATTVYVGMSGGVDSSVSAALLADAGFDVVGCFMSVWQPPFLDCSLEAERQDAMAVAAELGIDFKTIDLADEYKSLVVDYMISEYTAGRTPNPDVMCNGAIKFGAFYQWATGDGADFIATGHYARVAKQDGAAKLLEGVDTHKDQSYFLWQLPQERLAQVMFPVGEFEKSRVREIAEEFDLPVADKKDSQGLCFLGQVDMEDFLSEFVDTEPGDILNQSGDVVGTHDGAIFYTLGQRRGFEVTDKTPDSGPFYVADKDVEANTITVTEDKTESGALYNTEEIIIADCNWIGEPPCTTCPYQGRIRYNQPLQNCRIKDVDDAGPEKARVVFAQPQKSVAAGQSFVGYAGEECVGGGVIEAVDVDD